MKDHDEKNQMSIFKDQALNTLSMVSGLIGEFVRSFPGKNNINASPRWLEEWFQGRTNVFYISSPTSTIDNKELEEM